MPEPTSRRQFLARAAILAATAPTLGSFIAACSKSGQSSSSAPTLTIAAPDHPVKWDIPADNKPIADGLAPEKGATLQVYNYADYLSPDAVKSFEEKYNTKVQISTFNDTDEALTKIRGGNVDYDLYFPSYDQISKLVTGGLARPHQPQLHPEHQERVADLHQPLVRPGMAFLGAELHLHHRHRMADRPGARRHRRLPNPYDSLWDPTYKGKTAIIDDWHTAMAMVLLRAGKTDVNTTSAEDLKLVGDQLNALVAATSPKVTITMYSDMPAGQIGLCQMWSGDIINSALSYMPEGVSPDILRYWFPADGKGLVDNDLLIMLRSGKNPVLAHLFINHLLDPEVAQQNFAQTGYQPPQNNINPDSLVSSGFIPENLKSAVVKPEYFDTGYRLLELDPANDAAWHNVWRAFKAGGGA